MLLLNAWKKCDQLSIRESVEYLKDNGRINFIEALKIPRSDRLPMLVSKLGKKEIYSILVAMVGVFNNSLNLIRPMNAEQVADCALDLLETSQEDNLSLEDLTLFFEGAKKGQYGKILDRLDQQTIFELLENYREQRWQALQRYRDNIASEYKGLGPSERIQNDEMMQSFYNIIGRMGDMKDKLKQARKK